MDVAKVKAVCEGKGHAENGWLSTHKESVCSLRDSSSWQPHSDFREIWHLVCVADGALAVALWRHRQLSSCQEELLTVRRRLASNRAQSCTEVVCSVNIWCVSVYGLGFQRKNVENISVVTSCAGLPSCGILGKSSVVFRMDLNGTGLQCLHNIPTGWLLLGLISVCMGDLLLWDSLCLHEACFSRFVSFCWGSAWPKAGYSY